MLPHLSFAQNVKENAGIVLDMEPVADKWQAFGWDTEEIDGNDIGAIVAALDRARARTGRPKAVVLRTLPGKGVPTLETREKAHFVRVDPSEWDALIAEFERLAEPIDV